MPKIARFLVILSVSIAPQLLAGAVYYVDSKNGNDGNAGTSSAAPWRSVAKLNARSFSPGDLILFARGGVWRERLVVPSSGSSTNPITFGAYGSGADPMLTGADVVDEWTSYSTNIWRAALPTQANVVLFDGTKGNKKTGINALTSKYDWYYGGGALYVFAANNPSLEYTAPGVEAGQRDNVIVAHKAYIVFEDLQIVGANVSWGGALWAAGSAGANAITVNSCTVENNNHFGLFLQNSGNHHILNCTVQRNHLGLMFYRNSASYSVSNNLVSGGTYAYNTETGILVRGEPGSILERFGTISQVNSHDNGDNIYFNRADDGVISNCTLYSLGIPANGEGYGVGLCGADDVIVEYCDIHDNESRGIGICADEDLNPCTNDIVRYNRIHGNGTNPAHDMVGVQINLFGGAVCSGVQIYYNLIYDHNRTSPDRGRGVYIEGANISVDNNVFYNNQEGVSLLVAQANNCTIKNNIFLNNLAYHIGVWSRVTGSDINFNTYYPDSGSKFMWNGSAAGNFASWKSSSAQDPSSRVADPKFVDVPRRDFHLRSDSPCIDAGVLLNLTKDYDRNAVPFGSGVDTGALEYQAGAIPPLAASLSASPTTGDAPLSVHFVGSAEGGSSPLSFKWDFGDGTSSTSQNPSHTYASAGSYTATLTVTDGASATDGSTVTISVTASQPLSARIVPSLTSGPAPLAVSFSGSASGGAAPYSYRWSFGDGTSSTSQNPSHTYASAGSYTATLTVTDSASATDGSTVAISVTASQPLSGGIVPSLTSGPAPLAVSFSGSASGGAAPYSYRWSFGDGTSSASQNPSHTYASAGSYTATLTVTDSASATDGSTVTISVTAGQPLSARIVPSLSSGPAPLAVSFSGSASGGTAPYSYRWSFGDGTSSTSQNPSHTYASAGRYIAVLRITDSSSASTSETANITILPPSDRNKDDSTLRNPRAKPKKGSPDP